MRCSGQQVRELETELEAEQHRHVDTQKSQRKQDRRLQEVILQLDEGQKSQDRMKDMIDKLQQNNKQYKRQIEEAVSWHSDVVCLFRLFVIQVRFTVIILLLTYLTFGCFTFIQLIVFFCFSFAIYGAYFVYTVALAKAAACEWMLIYSLDSWSLHHVDLHFEVFATNS